MQTEQSFELTNKGIKIGNIDINYDNVNKKSIDLEKTIFNKYKISQYIQLCDVNIEEFTLFFENTMNKYDLFKKKELNTPQKVNEYINNCQFLYLLQWFNIIQNNGGFSFFKVLNNNVIIDDCVIVDITNNNKKLSSEIDKELRGIELYKNLTKQNKQKIIDTLYGYLSEFKEILYTIHNDTYKNFVVSDFLFLLANSLYNKNNIIGLSLISSEIHQKVYELNNEQKQFLFDDSEKINKLWDNRIIKIQSKLRIIVLYLFMKRNPHLFF